MLGIGMEGYWSLKQANQNIETMYQDRVVPLRDLKLVADMYAVNVIDTVNKANSGVISAEEALKNVRDANDTITKSWTNYTGTFLTDQEKVLVAEAEPLFKAANHEVGRLESKLGGMHGPVSGQLGDYDGPLYLAIDPISLKISELIDLQLNVAREIRDASAADFAASKMLNAMLVAISLVFIVLAAWLIIRSITRALGGEPRYAIEVARAVASGDFTREVKLRPGDQTSLLRAMNVMRIQLAGAIGDVGRAVSAIEGASREIAMGNADLSQRTESQASSLEETASSMEELTSTVKQNAENARQANQLVVSTAEIAVKGGAVVNEVVETMASIKDSSRKISDIIGVIDGIAFQTNILALNAAVEAARAGEQGRGFAVVASEVRNLAQRSAGAAKEIKALIEDSVGKVDTGGKLVDEAGKTMDEIVTSVKRVTDIMSEIAAASGEQSSGIEQVNQAVEQMDQMTQQNAALVEEAAAAAESLREQAGKLAEAVSVFHIDCDRTNAGDRRTSASAPATNKLLRMAPKHAARPTSTPMSKPKKVAVAGGGNDEWEEF